MKKWSIGKPDAEKAWALANQCGFSGLCASVLVSRGIETAEAAAGFFGVSGDGEALYDPFLIKDMQEAAEIIQDAVDRQLKICVYGDYDCDGITATAVLYTYLCSTGADVRYHINERSEGFGLCGDVIRRLHGEGIELIVTVDNGIAAVSEAELCKELGITLVITDHHRPGDVLPQADAVVDPHRDDCPSPYKELCGCGVALKLIAAMDGGDCAAAMEQFSDLAAVATVADVVPLTGENREIVSKGLRYLENTENTGLRALIEKAGVKTPISSTDAAFMLAPRINASGRLGSATDAVKMLVTEDPGEAEALAESINSLNARRKALEEEIIKDIRQKITDDRSVLYKKVIVISGEGWHRGLVGLAASHLSEKFGKPVFIISLDGDNTAVGSARSPVKFSVHEALLSCKELLIRSGGHKGAGGFSLARKNIEAFDKALQSFAEKLSPEKLVCTVHADKALTASELSVESVKSLSVLEPFGEQNKQPLFLVHGARLLEVISLSQGAHTKLKTEFSGNTYYALMFGHKTANIPYKAGDMLDMLVYPGINSYGGRESVDLKVHDCRVCGISQPRYLAAREAYEEYMRTGAVPAELSGRMIPSRDELAAVYRVIAAKKRGGFDDIFSRLDGEAIPYCKMMIAIDIFEELGFIKTDRYFEILAVIENAPKKSLDTSEIYRKLTGG